MTINNFVYSASALKMTEQFEGCRLTAYQDIVGVWTIGYGHISGVKAGMQCTQAQAEAWLAQDVKSVADAINAKATIALTQGQFDALVDFAFNLGIGHLLNSSLWKLLMTGNTAAATAEFEKWDKAGGVRNAGLRRRRLAEVELFVA